MHKDSFKLPHQIDLKTKKNFSKFYFTTIALKKQNNQSTNY